MNNIFFATIYLSFHLQQPIAAFYYKDKIFKKRTEDALGLYEMIFNNDTKFEDMLSGIYIWNSTLNIILDDKDENEITDEDIEKAHFQCTFLTAFVKVVLNKLLAVTYKSAKKNINISFFINEAMHKNNEKDIEIISNTILVADKILLESSLKRIDNFLQNQTQYDILCQQIEDMSETEFMQLFVEAGKEK